MNYPSKKNESQTFKLDGLISLNESFEKINLFQSFNKKKDIINIKLSTSLNNSIITFPMLNYKKDKDSKAHLNTNIEFVLKKYFLINS